MVGISIAGVKHQEFCTWKEKEYQKLLMTAIVVLRAAAVLTNQAYRIVLLMSE